MADRARAGGLVGFRVGLDGHVIRSIQFEGHGSLGTTDVVSIFFISPVIITRDDMTVPPAGGRGRLGRLQAKCGSVEVFALSNRALTLSGHKSGGNVL